MLFTSTFYHPPNYLIHYKMLKETVGTFPLGGRVRGDMIPLVKSIYFGCLAFYLR